MNYKLFFTAFLILIMIIACENTQKNEQKKSTKEIKIPKIEFIKKIDITGNTSLIFKQQDTEFDMYYEPFLLINNKEFPIDGFDNINRSSGEILSLSPDGKHFIMDYISIGYVDKEGEKTLHENYFCAVIDIQNKRLLEQMQSDCDGEWNAQNQWISGGKVIFTFD